MIKTLHNKKAQTVVEFSLLLVVAIVALIAIQGWIHRALQGRLRSEADSIGGQFSAGHANVQRIDQLDITSTEKVDGADLTRNTQQTFTTVETLRLEPYESES